MTIVYTWHDTERHPRNRPEDHTPRSFSLSFGLEDPEALHGIPEAIKEAFGVPAAWVSIDSVSAMETAEGRKVSKPAFLGYMNHYAYLMRELGEDYGDEFKEARAAWNNLYTLRTAYGITTAEAIEIRDDPDPRYWERPTAWNWAAE